MWRKMPRLGLLALAALNSPASFLAQAQPIKFEHLGLEQDLPQSSVCCILHWRLTFYALRLIS